MADKNTTETDDLETKEGFDQEGEQEEEHNGPDDDTMKFITDSIKSLDKKEENKEEDEKEDGENEEGSSDEEGKEEDKKEDDDSNDEEIDEGFVEAAREAGWKDEDIQKFAAEYKNEDLIDMIPHLIPTKENDNEDNTNASDSTSKINEGDTKETPLNLENIKDEETRKIVEEMDKRNKDLEERLNKQEAEKEELNAETHQQQLVNNVVRANEMFDGLDSKTYGKTKDLPLFPDGSLVPTSPQFKARQEVFEKATQFHEGLNIPWDTAVQDAIKLLGSSSEKEAGRKLVRQLKDHSKNLSPKRTKKSVEKQYRDEEDEKADAVRSIAREVGVELD